jgi:hypothetical protein
MEGIVAKHRSYRTVAMLRAKYALENKSKQSHFKHGMAGKNTSWFIRIKGIQSLHRS